MKKTLLIILCTIIACSCVMGGTLAYLMAETETVKNTFTIGSITISLAESTEDGSGETLSRTFRMSPGATIKKDPKVTVKEDSEACWLFVKLEKSANFDAFLTYAIADGWTELTAGSGIYWRAVSANDVTDGDLVLSVLKGDQVTVSKDVTNEQAKALIAAGNYPTLDVTAYAVQNDSVVTSAAAAWDILNP